MRNGEGFSKRWSPCGRPVFVVIWVKEVTRHLRRGTAAAGLRSTAPAATPPGADGPRPPLRVLDEQGPQWPHGVGSGILKVDYDQASWRAGLKEGFRNVCAVVRGRMDDRVSLHWGLSGLARIAARAAVRGKESQWASEQEYRQVALVHPAAPVKPSERESKGRRIKYLPVPARADDKLIWLDEVTVGPNQDAEVGRRRCKELLEYAGYMCADPEYPTISASGVPPCKPVAS